MGDATPYNPQCCMFSPEVGEVRNARSLPSHEWEAVFARRSGPLPHTSPSGAFASEPDPDDRWRVHH